MNGGFTEDFFYVGIKLYRYAMPFISDGEATSETRPSNSCVQVYIYWACCINIDA